MTSTGKAGTRVCTSLGSFEPNKIADEMLKNPVRRLGSPP
jgi:hypothetical protein